MVIPTRMCWMAFVNRYQPNETIEKIGAIRKKGFKMEWNSEWANRRSEAIVSNVHKFQASRSCQHTNTNPYHAMRSVWEHEQMSMYMVYWMPMNTCSKQWNLKRQNTFWNWKQPKWMLLHADLCSNHFLWINYAFQSCRFYHHVFDFLPTYSCFCFCFNHQTISTQVHYRNQAHAHTLTRSLAHLHAHMCSSGSQIAVR